MTAIFPDDEAAEAELRSFEATCTMATATTPPASKAVRRALGWPLQKGDVNREPDPAREPFPHLKFGPDRLA